MGDAEPLSPGFAILVDSPSPLRFVCPWFATAGRPMARVSVEVSLPFQVIRLATGNAPGTP